jgi:hypothetical protein
MLPEEPGVLCHEQRAATLAQAAKSENHFVRRRGGTGPKRQRDGQQEQRENIASGKAVFMIPPCSTGPSCTPSMTRIARRRLLGFSGRKTQLKNNADFDRLREPEAAAPAPPGLELEAIVDQDERVIR